MTLYHGSSNFIIHCRSGGSHDYDMVEGAMADDQIYNYISEYLNGRITRSHFFDLAKFNRPTHQIAFNTQRALQTLTYKSYREVAG